VKARKKNSAICDNDNLFAFLEKEAKHAEKGYLI
jgi:hypothetical protein